MKFTTFLLLAISISTVCALVDGRQVFASDNDSKGSCEVKLLEIPEKTFKTLVSENILPEGVDLTLDTEITFVACVSQYGRGAIDVVKQEGEEYFYPNIINIFRPLYRPLLLARGMSELNYLAAEMAVDAGYGRQLHRLEADFGLKAILPNLSPEGTVLDSGVSMSMGMFLVTGTIGQLIKAMESIDSAGHSLVAGIVNRANKPKSFGMGAEAPPKSRN